MQQNYFVLRIDQSKRKYRDLSFWLSSNTLCFSATHFCPKLSTFLLPFKNNYSEINSHNVVPYAGNWISHASLILRKFSTKIYCRNQSRGYNLLNTICLPVTHIYVLSNNTKRQFCSVQMMEKLEDILAAMEHNIVVRLDRIERCLDSVEEMVSFFLLKVLHVFLTSRQSNKKLQCLNGSPKFNYTQLYKILFYTICESQ